ncbi:MAG: acyl carrier protein [Wenzhouxiangellaceae bacterium]|nr:acyl carrier protein [Wenzhouxiangellaceae bacterium]
MSTSRERIHAAMQEAAAAALPELETIEFDAALTSDVGLDSVQVMDLVMEIEDRLDISIPVEILAEASTLAQLAERIEPLVERAS